MTTTYSKLLKIAFRATGPRFQFTTMSDVPQFYYHSEDNHSGLMNLTRNPDSIFFLHTKNDSPVNIRWRLVLVKVVLYPMRAEGEQTAAVRNDGLVNFVDVEIHEGIYLTHEFTVDENMTLSSSIMNL